MLIVRALTCFYTAVAAFVASTLASLIGAIQVSARVPWSISATFAIAFVAGSCGVFAMITGALMLALETRFSFSVLRQENAFITERVHGLSTADDASRHPQ